MKESSIRFFRIIDGLCEWQGKIFAHLLLLATLQVCLEVTLRYAFNAPTAWGLELTIYLCAATYVMAGAYAHRFDAHIRVDFLYRRWSPRTRALVEVFITDLLFFFFCGVLVYQSGLWAWQAVVQGLTSGTIWSPPIWPMRSILFLGSLLLLLQGVPKLIRHLHSAFGDRGLHEP